MLAILRQLQSYGIYFSPNNDGLTVCCITQNTDVLSLIEDHKWLAVQYSAHCSQMMEDFRAKRDVTDQIKTALAMSMLLEQLYHDYLYETDAIMLMRRHQHIYCQSMTDRGKPLTRPAKADNKSSVSKIIHDLFTTGNRRRLCAVRVRRLLIVAIPIVSQFGFEGYCAWVGWMEQFTAPVVPYLAWLTLFPRLSKNVFLIAKHVIPHRWMSDKEYALGLKTRFIAQVELHWFELANDMATVSVGLLNCFVLTGNSNIYLGFALFVFDVALAALRLHVDIRYLKKLEGQYETMSDKTAIDQGYLTHLRQRIEYEEKRLSIMVKNTVALLLAATFSLPMIAVNPWMPFIGAGIAVLTTIFNMIATQRVEQKKPDDRVTDILKVGGNRYGMFALPINEQNKGVLIDKINDIAANS